MALLRLVFAGLCLLVVDFATAADKVDLTEIYQNPLSNGFGEDIAWVKWEDAVETALEVNKPIFLLIHKTWCHACKSLKKSMQQSNARKAFKRLSENFVMVNTADDDEPFEEEYRPDGKYIPRLLFLDKNGDPLLQVKNKKAEYKNYAYYYSSPADILNSMKEVLAHFGIEVNEPTKGDGLKPKKPPVNKPKGDSPEGPQHTKPKKPTETKEKPDSQVEQAPLRLVMKRQRKKTKSCFKQKRGQEVRTVIEFYRGNDPVDQDNQCAGSCIAEMQALIDSTPFFRTTAISRSNSDHGGAINGKGEPNYTLTLFNKICDAYDKVDVCLVKCERSKHQHLQPPGRQQASSETSDSGRDIRQAYAGLQFICKERKDDFFEALPCLAEYEPSAMLKCNREINQSQDSTLLFTNAIVNREFQAIALRFSTLCRDLSQMMKCMEPTIRRGCGDKPTNLMLTFIGLEFSSFEKLNEQLGFEHSLPNSCRSLIHYSNERRLSNQGSRSRYTNSASLRNQNGARKNRKHSSYSPNACARIFYQATLILLQTFLVSAVYVICF
uniref:Thioredoxin domain-containing protein n=1 Tax=Ditylenchus dipsaci TaxID=166011 RepID=A0A915D1C2_9BILA